ncbi:hypothetical protein VPNG_07858 [Cytospora leucostoma]|uniref:FAD-binding domain-containing protein n=1 Tax=Cytospora leucostoma TaxID=1230097 RepID=A0A423WGU6_9PEZI|nr:hypothetical protein VPNG_07858 [Cytospora leucostoma]
MPFPKIAIIGAGPVGTTLARLLHLQCPSAEVTIFEGDASPDYRSQGGTLDLHTATGLAALKEAGLWGEFMRHARYDGEFLLMTDRALRPFYRVDPSPPGQEKKKGGHLGGQRPEIDRSALRRMLVESLPGGMVRWGHRLGEVRPGGEPREHELVFTVATTDGKTTTTTASGFDLIVGADGAWSKIRSVLTPVKPKFSGVSNQSFDIPDAERTAPSVYRAVNRGSIFSHADGVKTNLQQMGDGSIKVAVNFRTDDESWFRDGDSGDEDPDAWDLERAKAAMLARLRGEDGWHPIIREAITLCRGRTVPSSLYMLPVGFSHAHRAGLTLVGDAAHLMTPFAGEGVNVGMEDARALARAVVRAGEDLGGLDREVARFEGDMYGRCERFAALTESMLRGFFFTEGCPWSVWPTIAAAQARFHAPWFLGPVVGWLTWGYLTVQRLVFG